MTSKYAAAARLYRVASMLARKTIKWKKNMSRNYNFHNPEGVCFVSFAVVN